MKFLSPFGIFSFCFLMLNSVYAQDFEHPVQYNNYIIDEQSMITNRNLDYITTSVHSNDLNAIEAKRQQVIQQIQVSLEKYRALPGFEGDSKMRDEAVAVLETYLETFNIDFSEALSLKAGSQESFEAMEKYYEAQDRAERKMAKATDRFNRAQEGFARKHEFEIVEDEHASNKIKKIADLNEYTRVIYLKFFKVSKSNSAFFDALEAEKAITMDRKRVELQEDCSEALVFLDALEGFKGEKAYRTSAINLIEFHHNLAKDGFKTLVEVVEKKDKLTQEDVDNYNRIIEEYNNKSQLLINIFNEENTRLMKRHIPEPGKRT
ncbi:MAG: hypothetical protein AAF502_20600 [Bacteroidota bacterium]